PPRSVRRGRLPARADGYPATGRGDDRRLARGRSMPGRRARPRAAPPRVRRLRGLGLTAGKRGAGPCGPSAPFGSEAAVDYFCAGAGLVAALAATFVAGLISVTAWCSPFSLSRQVTVTFSPALMLFRWVRALPSTGAVVFSLS